MALIYHPNIRVNLAYYGIFLGLGSCGCTMYAGAQPAAADDVVTNWGTTYRETTGGNANLIWHADNGMTIGLTNNSVTIYGTAFPTAVAPKRNGTVTWAIIWPSTVTYAALNAATIPRTDFIVAPISITTGNGVLRMTSTTLTTATTTTISDFGFTVYL